MVQMTIGKIAKNLKKKKMKFTNDIHTIDGKYFMQGHSLAVLKVKFDQGFKNWIFPLRISGRLSVPGKSQLFNFGLFHAKVTLEAAIEQFFGVDIFQ